MQVIMQSYLYLGVRLAGRDIVSSSNEGSIKSLSSLDTRSKDTSSSPIIICRLVLSPFVYSLELYLY